MPTATIDFNSDFFIEMLKRYRRQHGGRRFGMVIKILGVVVLTPVAVSLFWQGLILLGLLISAWIILIFYAHRLDNWRARKAFLKSPFHDVSLTIEFTEDGFHAVSPIEDTKQQWCVFTEVVHFPDGVLLFKGPRVFNWIPFSSISDAQQIRELENLIREKVAKHKIIDSTIMPTDQLTTPKPKLRWFLPTPGRLLIVLLVAEAVLLLSERFQWFAFNEKKGWTVLIAFASVSVTLALMLLWFSLALVFRWRFQFYIRSLLVLTVAVAIPCSWLAVEMKWAKEQQESVEALVKLGGVVEYDYQMNFTGLSIAGPKPPEPIWLQKMIGDDFFADVTWVYLRNIKVTNADLECLKEMIHIQVLVLDNTQITDAALEYITGMKQLHTLQLSENQITDNGMKQLEGLNQLQMLYLSKTTITDEGLELLQGLTQLQTLDIGWTRVTNVSLEYISGMRKLNTLFLEGTRVTDDGVAKLHKSLPNVIITR